MISWKRNPEHPTLAFVVGVGALTQSTKCNKMDYQKVVETTGIYSLQDHLMALKQGFQCSRLSESLKEHVLEMKWNRNADAQKLVYRLLDEVEDTDTIHDTEKIDVLLDIVNADKSINDTPHTFDEHFSQEEE